MNDADYDRLLELRERSNGGFSDNDVHFLLRLIEQLMDQYDVRVRELLEANNREVERRRAAVAALRHLRRRFRGTVVDGQIPGAPGAAWVMDVDGKSVRLPDFIDAAIETAEAPP